ncbi:MAG: hypothetical protein HYV60_09210 [Planctomycetia bacterium]|nr:hypothetical protein [Planctomycetia bacterium]
MRIEFRGFDVAGVYPEQLPNVPAGTQQIVLARYLPQGKDQQGDIVVTGVLNGERVRYSTRVLLADAESGNSFIPRLWARKYLDHLLNQGVTPANKDAIVSLSQEYHIITPYTSLLVLESAADRERFQVKRRFQMRDGESYFAEGRDRASFELLSKQMKTAGESRLEMRRDVLRELSLLGRDVRFLDQSWDEDSVNASLVAPWSLMINDSGGGGFGGGGHSSAMSMMAASSFADAGATDALSEVEAASDDALWDDDLQGPEDLELAESSVNGESTQGAASDIQDLSFSISSGRLQGGRAMTGIQVSAARPIRIWGMPPGSSFRLPVLKDYELVGGEYHPGSQDIYWFQGLFPPLPVPPSQQPRYEQSAKWSEEAIALSKSLLRTSKLKELAGGVQIVTKTFDTRPTEPILVGEQLTLVSPTAWLNQLGPQGGHIVNWCNERERGVLSRAFLLGRVRPSEPTEVSAPPFGTNDYSLKPLHESLGSCNVEWKPQGDARTLLVTNPTSSPQYRILIDTERQVVLRKETLTDGRLQSAETFSDFVQVGGMWWATTEVWTDHNSQQTRRIEQRVELLAPQAFQQRFDAELSIREQAGLIHQPSPTVSKAKQSVAAGSAGFSERVTLMLHFALSQQWDRVDEQLAAAETLAGKDRGCRWIRYAILKASRRHEQLRSEFLSDAARLANRDAVEDVVLADFMIQESTSVLQPLESLELVDLLKSVYLRQHSRQQAMKSWFRSRVVCLSRAGKPERAFALQRQLANDYPDDYDVQNQFAVALAASGDYAAAYAWLEERMSKDPAEQNSYALQLRETYKHLLREQGKFKDLADFLEPLVAAGTFNPYESHQSAAAEYLFAIIASNPIERGHAVVREWLALANSDEKLDQSQRAKLRVAVDFASGQGFEMYSGQIDPEWIEPLAEASRALLRHQHHPDIAAQILSHPKFATSDTGLALLHDIGRRLGGDLDRLPASAIAQLASMVSQNATSLDATAWAKMANNLHDRWLREADARDQYSLGSSLSMVYGKTPDPEDGLEFLREQIARGNEKYRSNYIQVLFQALVQRDWTAEYEDEAFELLSRWSKEASEESSLREQIPALYALIDRLIVARYRPANGASNIRNG